MTRIDWLSNEKGWEIRTDWLVLSLLAVNLLCNVLANVSFKFSALSPTWRGFLKWQLAGNLAGFLTVLSFTALLRSLPLHIAYPITMGLAVIGVQLVAAGAVFNEAIPPQRWLGTILVVFGILLIGG
jgi:multidrug transporter EmrE-like cation transporter